MKVAAVVALVVGLVCCWAGLAIAGWSGLVWSVCAYFAVLVLAARLGVAGGRDRRPRREIGNDVADGYPHYRTVTREVGWAVRDGRYFANVVAPALRELAGDLVAARRGRVLSEAELNARLGAERWRVLTAGQRDRDDVPTTAELADIITALEGL